MSEKFNGEDFALVKSADMQSHVYTEDVDEDERVELATAFEQGKTVLRLLRENNE